MASLLDPRSQNIDRTKQVRVRAYDDLKDEEDRKRIAQETALAAAKANAASATAESEIKTQLPVAAVDIMGWAADPQYQQPYHKLPIEARQHFESAYPPSVVAQIPGLHNKTVGDYTGKIPGLEDFAPKQRTVDEKGNATTTYVPIQDPQSLGVLSDNQKKIAEAIARYDVPPSQALGRFSQADREKIIAFATDLGYDAKEYPVRQASRKDFTSGAAARSITSLNTLIHHFDQVLEAQKNLGNSDIPLLNAPINYLKKNVAGNDAITRFDTNASAVAEEMAKLLKGGVATKGEIEDWKAKLDRNLAPDQLNGNIQEMIRLMAGRVDGLRNQWQSAYDKPRDLPFLDADAQRILQKHGFDPHEVDPLATPGPAATSPPAAKQIIPGVNAASPSKAETLKAPNSEKPRVVRQNGVTYTLGPDGQYH